MIRAHIAASSKLSGAMTRVAQQLARWAPDDIVIVPNVEAADVIILHTIGYPETIAAVDWCDLRGKRYAVMQYCLRSTQKPDTHDWLEIWAGAAAVWSYYNLIDACLEDNVSGSDMRDWPNYYAPLGADWVVFEPQLTVGDRFTILTSGYIAEAEGIGECFEAAARVGGRVFHLGPPRNFRDIAEDHIEFGFAISDAELARAYSRSDFVAGLRRCEGFEMPAAEGLFCGARPVMLDREHYRHWFEPWAVFVPEAEPAVLTDALEAVFREGAQYVTDDERAAALEVFNWEKLVGGFWSLVLEEMG